jgi:hypothetical protein
MSRIPPKQVGHAAARRHFLKASSLALAAVAAARPALSQAQSLPPVDENDPAAKALGYSSDATKVDKAKFPKYEAGQSCSNCQLYQGKPGEASGPCSVFPGKSVSAMGWCNAHLKRA